MNKHNEVEETVTTETVEREVTPPQEVVREAHRVVTEPVVEETVTTETVETTKES